MEHTFLSQSHDETQGLAARLARSLVAPRVIALIGDLGMGKTTFARAFVQALPKGDKVRVKSPSFALHHQYDTDPVCHHLDLYRLSDIDHFESLGLQDIINAGDGYVLIEWPELISLQLPKNTIQISFEETSENSRNITISGVDIGFE